MKTLTETDSATQRRAVSQNGREKQVKRLIKKYETTIFSFFREFGLPLRLREIIRAYILASGGETVFEASHNELTDILFKRTLARLQADRETVRNNVKSLQRWQEKHQVELIRILEPGRRIKHPDGGEEYRKTKYELVLLDELVSVLYGCSEKEMASRVREAVARMRGSFVPEEKKPKLPTHYEMRKAEKTIFTKFGKVIGYAGETNRDPVRVAQNLIFKLQSALDDYVALRDENQKREAYISTLHASTTRTQATSYGDGGVENHHAGIEEEIAENLPSVRHPFMYSGAQEASRELAENESVEVTENEHVTFINSSLTEKFSDNPLENAALHYAIAGYPVFPLHNPIFGSGSARCSCRDWRTCDKVGKHPRTWHGVKDATTDLETIRQRWRKYPNANIGIATGEASGIFVLDVDPKSGGDYSLEDLEDSYGEMPGTLRQRTGSNGEHRIFRYPDVRIRNSVSAIAPGLDIRSDGGFIVASPSVHASGNRYEWHGMNTPVEPAPDWLIALILISEEERESRRQEQQTAGTFAPVYGEVIREGEGRNDYLFRQARGLVKTFSLEEVRKRVETKNLARCVPPLGEKELTKLLKSAEWYESQQIH